MQKTLFNVKTNHLKTLPPRFRVSVETKKSLIELAKELEEQIVITPIDVSNYYAKHAENSGPVSDQKEASKELNVTIVKHLRREKVEEAYKSWIKELQKKYTIEVNKAQWEKIIGP